MKEVRLFYAKWKSKCFMLSEKSQTQKALSGKGKILGMENRSVAAGVRAEYKGQHQEILEGDETSVFLYCGFG